MHVVAPVSSDSGLSQIIQLYPEYEAVLDPLWQTYVGVISDSNSSLTAAQFSSSVTSLGPGFEGWKFAGIFCRGSCTTSSNCSSTGTVYQELVTQTGGIAGDLCDLQNALSTFASQIIAAAKPACFFDLPAMPAGEPLDPRYLNVQYVFPGEAAVTLPLVTTAAACGTESGWYYDNAIAPSRVILCPASCSAIDSAPDATIEFLLGCLTIVRP